MGLGFRVNLGSLDQCCGSFIFFGVWDSLYSCIKDPCFFLGECGLSSARVLRAVGFRAWRWDCLWIFWP